VVVAAECPSSTWACLEVSASLAAFARRSRIFQRGDSFVNRRCIALNVKRGGDTRRKLMSSSDPSHHIRKAQEDVRMHSSSLVIRNGVVASCFVAFLSLFHSAPANAANAPSPPDSLPRLALLGVTAEPAPDNHIRIAKISSSCSSKPRKRYRSDDAIDAILLARGHPPPTVYSGSSLHSGNTNT